MSVYKDAVNFVQLNPGTTSAESMAKLILSLYNERNAFSISECLRSLDGHNLELAAKMVEQYGKFGEVEDLVIAGRVVCDLYPRLLELSQACAEAKREVYLKWENEQSS